MVIFYKKFKKYNEIKLTKNKMDLNNRKMTNHPPSNGRISQTENARRWGRVKRGGERRYCHLWGHLQLITILKIDADSCNLCQYKITKPNPEE